MMKKKLGLIYLSILVLSVSALFGQNAPSDIRRTAEERAAFEKSVPVNPAKTALPAQADLRDVQPSVSPTNWKPVVTPVDDRNAPGYGLSSDNSMVSPAIPVVNRPQPEGKPSPGKSMNYNGNAGSKTQPEAPAPANVTNRRIQNGTKTQPEGKTPKK